MHTVCFGIFYMPKDRSWSSLQARPGPKYSLLRILVTKRQQNLGFFFWYTAICFGIQFHLETQYGNARLEKINSAGKRLMLKQDLF